MPSKPSLSISHAALAEGLLPAVLAAGRTQLRYFRSGTAVAIKADRTPVTAADQESETILSAALTAVAPGVPVVAEEAAAAGETPVLDTSGSGAFFLVDPLDGTREFIAGRTEFTINIALVSNQTPRFGLIYAPALSQLFVTLDDERAFAAKLDVSAPARGLGDLAGRTIRSRAPESDGLVAVASRSHRTPGTDAFLGQYRIKDRKSAGSSLKFCLLAKGEADIYPRVGPTSEWDTAAGHAILTSAGGSVTLLDGAPLLYGKQSQKFRNPDFVAWGRAPLPPSF